MYGARLSRNEWHLALAEDPRDVEDDELLADREQDMRDERVIEDRGWEP